MEIPIQKYITRNNDAARSSTTTNKITLAQYITDARLMAEYDESSLSGKNFNYSKSVSDTSKTETSEDQINAYLTKIQRGGFVQPFGCMFVIEKPNFKIIGYSENCVNLLGLNNNLEEKKITNLIGVDARTLFTASSNASLAKIIVARELSLLNPIWVHSSNNNRSFYAILHRIDVGIVVDLEPASSDDPSMIHVGTMQYQKLAMRAISRMQSLPRGDINVLCDAVVEDVQKLTGYDRVMVYKFHEDNHGEVISEIRRSDLEPYLGVHYPATDIPLAARFLFIQNRVRIICDSRAQPVKVIQSKELKKPLCLLNSTIRSPHDCHVKYMMNMGSISSMVMAIIINNGCSLKLWGLMVCHHSSPRYVPFPLRCACEFFMQTFNLQLHMELQMASQLVEKKILQTQTLLSDIILRDTLTGIMTQSPNIMDLVKCDGAALYYGRKYWLLGVTPTESQLQDIIEWLLKKLGDSSGFSTDSLVDAGYSGGVVLGPTICGIAIARISSSEFLMWFRSSETNEFKWGGAKHHPKDKDGGKMHPRTSFNAFFEVVEHRSIPWEDVEINAIHSLELIMREFLEKTEKSGSKLDADSQLNDSNETQLDEITSITFEMIRLIETAAAPIFGVDSSGLINGWNTKMFELTGLEMSEAIGKSLLIDIVHKDSRDAVETLLVRALQGKEDKNVEVKLLKFGANAQNSVVYILINSCMSRSPKNDVVGICFVGQDLTNEKIVLHKFKQLQGNYNAIIQSVNPLIPPIFASDENACCSEWNAVMENLTGWMRHETIGKMLPGEIFGSLCRLQGPDVLTKFMILLNSAINGYDTEGLTFGFFNRKQEFVEVYLTTNKNLHESGNVIGCLCFFQTIPITRNKLMVDKQGETEQLSKELAHKLLEGIESSDDKKRVYETSAALERRILSIINNSHVGRLEEGKIELKVEEFLFGNLVNVIVSQAMILLKEKNLQIIYDIPDQIKNLNVYGDEIKLQLALSDFLHSVVNYASYPDGWVEVKVSLGLKLIQDGDEYVHLELRMAHPGNGLPYPLIEDMFSINNHWTTQEGSALNISHKLLSMMNGKVRYVREQNRCYFQIDLELKSRI